MGTSASVRLEQLVDLRNEGSFHIDAGDPAVRLLLPCACLEIRSVRFLRFSCSSLLVFQSVPTIEWQPDHPRNSVSRVELAAAREGCPTVIERLALVRIETGTETF